MNISATSPLVSVLLLLVSMSSIQASASLAKTIFPLVGPAGTTALRLLVASAILLVVMRPWKKAIPRSAWKVIAVFGLATASMNLCFYEALSRIPLGVAVGLEFTGPLTVAMLSSRGLVDFIWVILAAAGLPCARARTASIRWARCLPSVPASAGRSTSSSAKRQAAVWTSPAWPWPCSWAAVPFSL